MRLLLKGLAVAEPRRLFCSCRQLRGSAGCGLVKVVAPIDDAPAAKAGVMANDLKRSRGAKRIFGQCQNLCQSDLLGSKDN